jgi:hypothetical protein
MYPSTVAASRKGRHVFAVVPSAVGLKYATPNDATKIAAHAQVSDVEKGDGLLMGSAGTSCVFTSFLTASAVYPATASEANQPPTREEKQMKTILAKFQFYFIFQNWKCRQQGVIKPNSMSSMCFVCNHIMQEDHDAIISWKPGLARNLTIIKVLFTRGCRLLNWILK